MSEAENDTGCKAHDDYGRLFTHDIFLVVGAPSRRALTFCSTRLHRTGGGAIRVTNGDAHIKRPEAGPGGEPESRDHHLRHEGKAAGSVAWSTAEGDVAGRAAW